MYLYLHRLASTNTTNPNGVGEGTKVELWLEQKWRVITGNSGRGFRASDNREVWVDEAGPKSALGDHGQADGALGLALKEHGARKGVGVDTVGTVSAK